MAIRFLCAALALLLSACASAVFPGGSTVGLGPPPGMLSSPNFPGFQDEANDASIVLDLFPTEAYMDLAAGFSDDAELARQGIIAVKRENLIIAGNPALVVMGRQSMGGNSFTKWGCVCRLAEWDRNDYGPIPREGW